MKIQLSNKKFQDFIRNYKNDLSSLAFKGSPFPEVETQELLQQIESRRRIENKLPTWFKKEGILYSPKLNLEQTSSEVTATYKASLVKGKTLADITGGFGVDSYFFSDNFDQVFHFETNTDLSQIAKHNFKILNKDNVKCSSEDGIDAILKGYYDIVYADPSRRHESKGKVYFLKDCEPNLPKNISEILNSCKQFILKTSPMLDISIGLDELLYVSQIHIIAINNEVKELLWILEKNATNIPVIKTINLTKVGTEKFNFHWREEANASIGSATNYLYEPNAAIFKSGAFDIISERFSLKKLHRNTHLYSEKNLIDFPGRRFKIEQIIPYSKAGMRTISTIKKANISIRNFPESVATLRKKWKIKDGGSTYLFFVTNMDDKKEVLICSKI